MGPEGVGVADPVDDGNFALIVKVPHQAHAGMESHLVVKDQYFVLRYSHCRPVVSI